MAPTIGADLIRAISGNVDLTGLTALGGKNQGGNGALHLTFSNGLVISILRSETSYGNKNGEGLFEATHWYDDQPSAQPKGWLTHEQVVEYIRDTLAEHGPTHNEPRLPRSPRALTGQGLAQYGIVRPVAVDLDATDADFIPLDLIDPRKA